jgi:hypothetical protein
MTLRDEVKWLWRRPGVTLCGGLLLAFCVIRPAIQSAQAGHVWWSDPQVLGSGAIGVTVFVIAVALARAFRRT